MMFYVIIMMNKKKKWFSGGKKNHTFNHITKIKVEIEKKIQFIIIRLTFWLSNWFSLTFTHSINTHTNTSWCTHFVDFSRKLNPNDNHLNNFISIKQDYRFFSSFSFLYRCKKNQKRRALSNSIDSLKRY